MRSAHARIARSNPRLGSRGFRCEASATASKLLERTCVWTNAAGPVIRAMRVCPRPIRNFSTERIAPALSKQRAPSGLAGWGRTGRPSDSERLQVLWSPVPRDQVLHNHGVDGLGGLPVRVHGQFFFEMAHPGHEQAALSTPRASSRPPMNRRKNSSRCGAPIRWTKRPRCVGSRCARVAPPAFGGVDETRVAGGRGPRPRATW